MNSSREYIHHSSNMSALSARISKMTSKFANVTAKCERCRDTFRICDVL